MYLKFLQKELSLVFLSAYLLLDLTLNFLLNERQILPRDWSLYFWSTFTLVEYLIFTYFLWVNIKNQSFRKAILVLSLLFIVFTTVYNIITNFEKIDSIPIGIEAILIFVYSFYYLYEQMNDPTSLFIYSKYQFWVVLGFLVYLAGSFFIFIFASGVDQAVMAEFWPFTNIFFILMNIMFMIAFYIKARKPKQPTLPKISPYLNL